MIYKCEKCGARLDPGEKCDCTTKKEASRGNENAPERKRKMIPTKSISRKKRFVNDLQKLRINALASPKEFVADVKTLYPKFDKTLESKCEHGEIYGIQLRPDAMRLLVEKWGKPNDGHKLRRRVSARLTDDVYDTFQIFLEAKGYATVQEFLSSAISSTLNNTVDKVAAAKAQDAYCERHNVPRFAPSDGRCYRCYSNIYTKISVGEAGNRLITACPHCRASFCD